MRYQERIYEQINTFTRNRSVNLINTSSDISVFYTPQFDVSGATKVQCGGSNFTISGVPYNTYLTAATASCIGTNLDISCFTGSTWNTNIYANNNLAYSSTFFTSNTTTGTPTDALFIQSIITGLTSLNYTYTLSGNTFHVIKPYGIQSLDIGIDVIGNFEYVPPFTCPSGFIKTPANDGCEQVNTTPSVFNGSGSTITSGNTLPDYGNYGTYFYPNLDNLSNFPLTYNGTGFLLDTNNNVISPLTKVISGNRFWVNSGNTTDGRLNKVGLYPTSEPNYAGFAKCINISSGGTYYIGLAADNDCQFTLNGQLLVNFSGTSVFDFKVWSVFPVTLQSGNNIIQMLGSNQGGTSGSFGAEIYYPSSFSALTAATSTASTQANTIFTTNQFIGKTWELGTTFGYSCPSGYSLNTCGTAYTCTRIVKQGFQPICTGNCNGDIFNVADVNFPTITNGSNGVYVMDPNTGTTIPFTFNFTGNTNSFITNNATFNYGIYQFNPALNLFTIPPVYASPNISYSAFSGTNSLTQAVTFSASSDGDYLVKGYVIGDAGTKYLDALGVKINTIGYINNSSSSFYNPDTDFYFVAIYGADSPVFSQSQAQLSNNAITGTLSLSQQVIIVGNTDNTYTYTGSTFTLVNTYNGQPIITLNGLTLANGHDYTLNGQILTFLGPINLKDVITITSNQSSSIVLTSESIYVNTVIPSGSTNNHGNSTYYYNTTTGKYEIYLLNTPLANTTIVVMLNGITLVNNIDYYQSTSNPNRIILNGTLLIDDIIMVIFNPKSSVINGIYSNNNLLNWHIKYPPMGNYGNFEIQYSTDNTFTTYTVSNVVPYSTNVVSYSGYLSLTGDAGTNLYYRIKNTKSYPSKCGDPIVSVAYSETVPITILSNALNSY